MYPYLHDNSYADKVSDRQIQEMEAEFGLKLPERLKEFHKHYSNVPMDPVRLPAGSGGCTIDGFIPLFSTSMSAEHMLEIYRQSGRMPQSYFPLAVSSAGDDIFLDTASGHVYLISMDLPKRSRRLASSLDAFFDLLEAFWEKEQQEKAEQKQKSLERWRRHDGQSRPWRQDPKSEGDADDDGTYRF